MSEKNNSPLGILSHLETRNEEKERDKEKERLASTVFQASGFFSGPVFQPNLQQPYMSGVNSTFPPILVNTGVYYNPSSFPPLTDYTGTTPDLVDEVPKRFVSKTQRIINWLTHWL